MAEALVGGAFLSATLQVLFDRMASREVLDFFRRRKLDDGLLKNLKITLLAVNAVLDDAEEQQITKSAVKKWLDELKDAVYDAEDLLDQIATEALQSELEAGTQTFMTQVWGFISTLIPFDEGIISKIKKIIENIEYIAKQKELLGLRKGVGRKPSPSLPTTSLVDESGVYGREDDKQKLTRLLLSNDASGNGICVITIIGFGGIGKTTLAQLLYNDETVNEYFDLKAWVCVSEEFDVFKVHKTVLGSVNSQVSMNDDLNSLQVKLRKILMGKKFLIVLDDIWNDNYNDWDKLRTPFGAGGKGSKIIVTTRSESVASIMCTVPPHYLEHLPYQACWSLFSKHAFGNENPNAHPNKEIIGKQIVEKCKGLPLAIKTLGGLLRSKQDVKEWNDVLKSNIWDLPNDNILPALRLSYHHLPTHLKQCFAYCCIFPKDYMFKKEKLILLWMAEGFMQQQKSEQRIEEVGDEYFRELSSRSFFQQSRSDKSSFVMHDLINDLAQYVSREFCYRLEGDKSHKISRKVRHFSYFREEYNSYEKFEPFNENKGLRTFLPFNPPSTYAISSLSNKVLHDMLPTLSCLRVLSLSHFMNISKLPNSIGNLKQLRYLDISGTKIQRLPEVICTLCNLQTLILSDCGLTLLPVNIGKLTNLRHLDTSGTNLTEMPIQMSGLKSLQTLTSFVVGKHDGLRVGDLRELRHLQGRLSILKLQNVVNAMDAWEANLKEKEHLDELHLEWGWDTDDLDNERDVLDKLQPSTTLRKLTIKYYGGTSFPIWLGDRSFKNMTVLYLEDCMHCSSLPPLGQLPSLVELSIKKINLVERVGLEFHGSGSTSTTSFQKLKTLKFEKMSEWEEWSFFEVQGRIFPSLEVLSIRDCPKLRGDLPNHLPFLKELIISECYQLMASIPNDATSIRTLKLQGCKEMVLSSIIDRSSLESLHLRGFCEPFTSPFNRDMVNMPSLLHGLTSLKDLGMVLCSTSLLLFPETGLPSMLHSLRIDSCFTQTSFPEGMLHHCTRLQRLTIRKCPRLKSFSRGGLPTTLKHLFISGCEKLELVLPEAEETHNYYASLESLSVGNSCDSLKSFPLGLFPKLNDLHLWDCQYLESLCISEEGLHNDLTSLRSLLINSCPKFVSFPKGGLPAPNLTSFNVVGCKNFKSLPESMHTLLPSLQKLTVTYCPELDSFPEGGLPSNLIRLEVLNCDKLTACRMQWGLHTLASLKHFQIGGCKVVESFPVKWLLPSGLTSIEIYSLPNLKHLDKRGFQHLTSLRKLLIWYCPVLQSLPEEGLPASLSLFNIRDCPLLEQRCQMQKGEDWPKISHIPRIVINRNLIS